MGLLNGVSTSLGQFGANFVLSFFFTAGYLLYSVGQSSFDVIGWSLWKGVLLPPMLPTEINGSQLEIGGVRIRLQFLLLNSSSAE